MSDRLAEVITTWRAFRLTLSASETRNTFEVFTSGRLVRESDNAWHYGRAWHSAGRRGGVPLLIRVESGAGRQSIRTHRVDGPRGLFQGYNRRNCPDAGRVPLAGYGIRLASIRRCPVCPMG